MADGLTERLLLETLARGRNVLAFGVDRKYLSALTSSRALLATRDPAVLIGLPRGAFSLLVLAGRRELLERTRRLASPAAIFVLFELRDGARPNVPGFGAFKAVACDGGLLTLWRLIAPVTGEQTADRANRRRESAPAASPASGPTHPSPAG
jgi:hypothetical protein